MAQTDGQSHEAEDEEGTGIGGRKPADCEQAGGQQVEKRRVMHLPALVRQGQRLVLLKVVNIVQVGLGIEPFRKQRGTEGIVADEQYPQQHRRKQAKSKRR